MSGTNRWVGKKTAHTMPLSLQQQTLLAAVPRWKRAWVKASAVDGKPSTSNVLIRKWIIDTSAQKEEGTEEEMKAAAIQVIEIDQESSTPIPGTPNNTGGDDLMSGFATPAIDDGEVEIIEPKVAEEVAKPHPLRTEVMLVDSEDSPIGEVPSTLVATELDTPMIDEPILPSPIPESLVTVIESPLPSLLSEPIIIQNPSKPETGPPEIIDDSLPPAAEAISALQAIPLSQELVDVDMSSTIIEDEVQLAAEALLEIPLAVE